MPSWAHDGLVALLQQHPDTVSDLLRHCGVDLAGPLEPVSNDFTDVKPAELRADAVFLTATAPPLVVIVEIQRGRDDTKPYAWPAYVANARLRHRCPAVLLVIALDRRIARWSAQPVELLPGQWFRPLVIGPDSIPVVADPQMASANPELACLAALAHRTPELVEMVAQSLWPHPDERTKLALDILLAGLSTEPHLLEVLMRNRNYEYQSEFARKYFLEGREEGLQEGLQEGREEGIALGRQSLVHALLQLLATRGIATSDADKARITAAEISDLQVWIPRAAVVDTAEDLFAV